MKWESKRFSKIASKNDLIVLVIVAIVFGGMIFSYNNEGESHKVNQTYVQEIETSVSSQTIKTDENVSSLNNISSSDDISTKEVTVNPRYLESTNPLMNLTVKTVSIPKIDANRGCVEISKEDFSKVTKDEYLEFCENVVSLSGGKYNYFTIDFGNGTGIYYTGCFIYDGTYGILDDTGAVVEKQGSISIDLSTKEVSSDIFSFSIAEVTTVTTTVISEVTTIITTEKETEPPQLLETVPITNSYVLNTSTMKFHNPSCRDIEKISQENYATFDGSRDDVIAQGYNPCGHCNP